MYYKKVMDLQGAYCDALGIVYDVHVARRVRNAQGVNVGYEEFPSLEAALEHWGLVACLPQPEAPPTDEQIS